MRIDDVNIDEHIEEKLWRKHGVSFEEARSLFTSGAEYLKIHDLRHDEDEDRYVAVGPVARGILCVAFIKIRHVRPFKQKLILELTEAAGETHPHPASSTTATSSTQPARAG